MTVPRLVSVRGPTVIAASGGMPSPSAPGQVYSHYLRRRGWRLRFDSPLEAEYKQHRVEQSIWLLRLSMALAVGFYLSFLLLDLVTLRRFQAAWAYQLLWGVGLPTVAAVLAATFLPIVWHWLPQLTRAVVIANAGTLVTALLLGHLHGMTVPSQILIIHLLYNFFLAGLMLRAALPVALATVLGYLAAGAFVIDDPGRLLDDVYFLGATVLLGAIAGNLTERTHRMAWLQSRLLQEMAHHDSLTGLLNRRSFLEKAAAHLRHSAREGKAAALLLIDADHFKSVNDTHGHLAGDECLRRIAARIAQGARRPLDLSARLGGEEFVLLLYDTNLHWAMHAAQQLRQAVSGADIEIAGVRLRTTISIGIALHEAKDHRSVEELIGVADRSLYQAKSGGRNRVCVNA